MITKLDTRHRYSNAPRLCSEKVFLGIGGAGREAARTAYMQERAFFGRACPYSLVAEIDLCGETGKYRYQVIELAALVREYGWRNVCWCCRNIMNSYVYYRWGLCWRDPDARYALLEWWLSRFDAILRHRDRDGVPDLRHGRDRWLYAMKGKGDG